MFQRHWFYDASCLSAYIVVKKILMYKLWKFQNFMKAAHNNIIVFCFYFASSDGLYSKIISVIDVTCVGVLISIERLVKILRNSNLSVQMLAD